MRTSSQERIFEESTVLPDAESLWHTYTKINIATPKRTTYYTSLGSGARSVMNRFSPKGLACIIVTRVERAANRNKNGLHRYTLGSCSVDVLAEPTVIRKTERWYVSMVLPTSAFGEMERCI